MLSPRGGRGQAALKLAERNRRLLDERNKIEAEMQAKIDRIHQQREIADAAMSGLPKDEEAFRRGLSALAKESEEAFDAEWAERQELEDRTAPIDKVLLAWPDLGPLEESGSVGSQRENLDRSIGTFSRLTKLRLVLEIIFPAAYAVFALVWTVVWTVIRA